MDKGRIDRWINGAISVAHELSGKDKIEYTKTIITLPFDVAQTLIKNGFITLYVDGDMYYNMPGNEIVLVKTSNPKRNTSKMTIKIYK